MPPPSLRERRRPTPTSRGQQVLELRQLDLPLAFLRSRAPGEDVENELRAIEAPSRLTRASMLRELGRRELVVEDHHVDVLLRRRRARSDRACPFRRTSPGRAAAAPERHTQGDVGAGGVGEAGQFLERLFGNMTALGPGDKAHERSALTPGTGHVNHRKEERFLARDPTVSRQRARGAARHH